MSTQKIKHVDEAEFTAHPQDYLAALHSGEAELLVVMGGDERFEVRKLVPPRAYGCLAGKIEFHDDVDLTEPVVPAEEWEALR